MKINPFLLIFIVAVLLLVAIKVYSLSSQLKIAKNNQDKVVGNWNGIPIIEHSSPIGPPNWDFSKG